MNTIESFNQRAEDLIEKMRELIEELPYQGDTCEDSQKVCLESALYGLEKNINGLVDDDFIDQEEDYE